MFICCHHSCFWRWFHPASQQFGSKGLSCLVRQGVCIFRDLSQFTVAHAFIEAGQPLAFHPPVDFAHMRRIIPSRQIDSAAILRLLALHTPRWNNPRIIIGDRLCELREEKKLSQGDIEKRTGPFRCYISRVENGHTVPAIENIEKFARALEIPM